MTITSVLRSSCRWRGGAWICSLEFPKVHSRGQSAKLLPLSLARRHLNCFLPLVRRCSLTVTLRRSYLLLRVIYMSREANYLRWKLFFAFRSSNGILGSSNCNLKALRDSLCWQKKRRKLSTNRKQTLQQNEACLIQLFFKRIWIKWSWATWAS